MRTMPRPTCAFPVHFHEVSRYRASSTPASVKPLLWNASHGRMVTPTKPARKRTHVLPRQSPVAGRRGPRVQSSTPPHMRTSTRGNPRAKTPAQCTAKRECAAANAAHVPRYAVQRRKHSTAAQRTRQNSGSDGGRVRRPHKQHKRGACQVQATADQVGVLRQVEWVEVVEG